LNEPDARQVEEVHRVRFKAMAFLHALLCCGCAWAGGANHLVQQLQAFKSLPGSEQVAVVFRSRFHGRSMLFWRRSSEVFRTEADAQLSFEQDILVASADPAINGALENEIEGHDPERARFAVFLLCLRARFVPRSEFLVKQMNGQFSSGGREGNISQFRPDLAKLDGKARLAINNALASPNARLRNSTKIYTFALLEELSSISTTELARRWRVAIGKVPACLHDRSVAYSDEEQVIPILRMALTSRGLESAVAISMLLKNERNPEALEEEIQMVRFLDSAAVRLRGSENGRQVILAVKDGVLTHTLQYCWMRYDKTERERKEAWAELEGQFFKDRVECSLNSWATLIALAMEQEYGDQLTVPAVFVPGSRTCGPKMQVFLTRLTDFDPSFPAWQFPSTGTPDDMLHPAFASKIRLYHDAWIKMTTEPAEDRN
jgi:hypothetical protein